MRTPTDAELKEFLELQQTIKVATKRLEEIKAVCKERGTFHTRLYACVVVEQPQERLAGLESVSLVFGRDVLESNGLINRFSSLIVKVAPIMRIKVTV